MVWTCRT